MRNLIKNIKTSDILLFLAFVAIFLLFRIPWLDCDAGIPSMWEYGYNVTDEGYYLVGGKEFFLHGHFVDLPRAETATYGYAPGLHYLSLLAHYCFGLSDWAWRIPFVLINFCAWSALFVFLTRKTCALTAFLVLAAFSMMPMVIAYERTASNDVLIGSLMVLSCVLAYRGGWCRLIFSSLAIAAVSLVKPSVWVLLPLSVIAALRGYPVKEALRRFAVFAISFAVALGVIGEYVGKIYLETKHRPRYIISDRV